ncbi:Ppx/GppA phosphatase family protein [Schaalia sp. lx-100]|uniref:Ppx/GppA phosphatase family protein n=1 Tax=Schaalia sp. lx-100 TaxID=2899081 RepID=UPI001E385BE9|nr:Ppx/GppA phosphatase family protein [Schaalia sp. lx-100]MCD4558111.1 Ppx/GppA family phosphatase [Schaalia sp. lx-100]
MTRIAAIDCGTNSIRLLLADVTYQGDRPVLTDYAREMRIVRLGQGVDKTGLLAPEAIERSLVALREYRALIDEAGVSRIRFVATSAMRDAANRQVFIDGVEEILGVTPEVVPGTEEAALSFSGALSVMGPAHERPVLVVDIGGGSTELVLGDCEVTSAISIDMGSVRVSEKFFENVESRGGIPQAEQEAAIRWIDEQLDCAEEIVDLSSVKTVVGVAGTVTTITAQALGLDAYNPQAIHGAELGCEDINSAVRFMVDQPVALKASLGFMPKGRADVIAGGALIWQRVVARVCERTCAKGYTIDTVLTSEHDILDGIALSMVK